VAEETPPQGSPGEEQSPPPAAQEAPAPGVSKDQFEFERMPGTIGRVLRDPIGSLEATHPSGMTALLQGLIFGVGTALAVPLLQLLFLAIEGGRSTAGRVFEAIAGGLLFMAVAVVLGFVLRQGKGTSALYDDVYMVGTSMLFLLAGVIGSGILSLLDARFFQELAQVVGTAGWVLTVLTYCFGLTSIGQIGTGKASWTAVGVLSAALLAGHLLHFNPLSGSPLTLLAFDAGDIGHDVQRSMQQGLENLFKGLPR
jgi:hypothetical protein